MNSICEQESTVNRFPARLCLGLVLEISSGTISMTLIIVQTVFQSVLSTLSWFGFFSGIRALDFFRSRSGMRSGSRLGAALPRELLCPQVILQST